VAFVATRPQQMSYAEYLALPSDLRAEWLDGEVIVTPSPTPSHQQAARRLANALEAALPRAYVVEAVTVRLPVGRERIPDVCVVRHEPEDDHIDEVPAVAVEVMSPGTLTEDTARKSAEYFASGVEQYWLADPAALTVEVLARATSGWMLAARLDEQTTTLTVDVLDLGAVRLDRAALFR
jgi:Uma2 family endonuclease